MRYFIENKWLYSEDEIDAAYEQGYEDGKNLALEESNEDDFKSRNEDNPYHSVWIDNARIFGFFKNPFCRYYLTQSKIIMEHGVFSEISEPILLYRVTKSWVERSIGQRLFGVGNIVVKTSKHEYVLKNVKNPKTVNAVILKYVDLNRKDRVKISEFSSERGFE